MPKKSAYLSTNARGGANAVNARDRIGNGPWQDAKGSVIATSVGDLHSDNTKMGKAHALDEMGRPIKVRGDSPVMHDIMTGSDKDGRAFPPNMDLTCSNWTSSSFGVAMLGHADREGNPPVAGSKNIAAYTETAHSWNAAHTSRGCSQPDLIATVATCSFIASPCDKPQLPGFSGSVASAKHFRAGYVRRGSSQAGRREPCSNYNVLSRYFPRACVYDRALCGIGSVRSM
jgi:hypothetical protein